MLFFGNRILTICGGPVDWSGLFGRGVRYAEVGGICLGVNGHAETLGTEAAQNQR